MRHKIHMLQTCSRNYDLDIATMMRIFHVIDLSRRKRGSFVYFMLRPLYHAQKLEPWNAPRRATEPPAEVVNAQE
jgi:hypothetical protein